MDSPDYITVDYSDEQDSSWVAALLWIVAFGCFLIIIGFLLYLRFCYGCDWGKFCSRRRKDANDNIPTDANVDKN